MVVSISGIYWLQRLYSALLTAWMTNVIVLVAITIPTIMLYEQSHSY